MANNIISPDYHRMRLLQSFDLMRLAKIGVYLKNLYVVNTVNMTGPRGQYRMDLHNLDLFITNTDVDI
jgi:hypothetical protein